MLSLSSSSSERNEVPGGRVSSPQCFPALPAAPQQASQAGDGEGFEGQRRRTGGKES